MLRIKLTSIKLLSAFYGSAQPTAKQALPDLRSCGAEAQRHRHGLTHQGSVLVRPFISCKLLVLVDACRFEDLVLRSAGEIAAHRPATNRGSSDDPRVGCCQACQRASACARIDAAECRQDGVR